MNVKFSQCCNPLPGDDIVGFITRGHGLSIHTKSCVNYLSALKQGDPETLARWVDVSWTNKNSSQLLPASIEVLSVDRVGLMYDVTRVLAESHIGIIHSNSRAIKGGNAAVDVTISVSGTEQLDFICGKLREIKGVYLVKRPNEKNSNVQDDEKKEQADG